MNRERAHHFLANRPNARILVRGVNWLGDAIMTLPAINRLREAFPAAHIALLTLEKLSELWVNQPIIDRVLPVAKGTGLFAVARRLRQEQFDVALVLPNSHRSALEVFLARIPERVGVARPWRDALLTRPTPRRPGATTMSKRPPAEIRRRIAVSPPLPRQSWPPSAHQLHEYLHLTAALGADPTPLAPRLQVGPNEVEQARSKWLGNAPRGLPWVGLNPGAEYGPAKRWPIDRFAETAITLHRQTGCGCLLLGGPNDRSLTEKIAFSLQQARIETVVNLAGQTSLRELSAVLKLCRLLLTNDTGPMHLAAAVGTPVVVPFGSTSPELTGPGWPGEPEYPHALVIADVPCAPCFQRQCPIDFRCMAGLNVDQVLPAALRVMKTAPRVDEGFL